MRQGLARHGIEASFVPRGTLSDCDVAVIWGFKPPEFVHEMQRRGTRLLVMERGYFPDRMVWSSLGWDGLNNRARFPECPDRGERFAQHWPKLLQPWKDGGRHILLIGQVPGDAALYGLNLDAWAQDTTRQIQQVFGTAPILFRPHPLVLRTQRVRCPVGAELSTGTLQEDFAGAKCTVTFNSNTGVESVCYGIPTVTLDIGAMAWPVTSHALDDEIITPDRAEWTHKLAWCQWRIEEIADGTAWDTLKNIPA